MNHEMHPIVFQTAQVIPYYKMGDGQRREPVELLVVVISNRTILGDTAKEGARVAVYGDARELSEDPSLRRQMERRNTLAGTPSQGRALLSNLRELGVPVVPFLTSDKNVGEEGRQLKANSEVFVTENDYREPLRRVPFVDYNTKGGAYVTNRWDMDNMDHLMSNPPGEAHIIRNLFKWCARALFQMSIDTDAIVREMATCRERAGRQYGGGRPHAD